MPWKIDGLWSPALPLILFPWGREGVAKVSDPVVNAFKSLFK